MNVVNLPAAILAFIGVVAILPVWMHFLGAYTPGMPPAATWIARFSLPAMALLFVGSWMGRDAA